MIKPTIGRVVWFTPAPGPDSRFTQLGDQPLGAFVAYVHNDRMVNLHVIDHAGNSKAVASVPLLQGDEPKPDGAYCEWMPYQKGQAAKTEQLERAAGGAA